MFPDSEDVVDGAEDAARKYLVSIGYMGNRPTGYTSLVCLLDEFYRLGKSDAAKQSVRLAEAARGVISYEWMTVMGVVSVPPDQKPWVDLVEALESNGTETKGSE